jgi:hypothetical protein
MEKPSDKLFCYYRLAFGFFYRGLKKLLRRASAHHMYTGCMIEGKKMWYSLEPHKRQKPSREHLQQYKSKWSRLSSKVPGLFMHLYPSYSGVKSENYVPDNLFFTHVEPMLNNVEYSRSFADKNLYSMLVDEEVLPDVFLRKMHGSWYDGGYNKIAEVEQVLKAIAKEHKRAIIKHAVASQGGENIASVRSDGKELRVDGDLVNRIWLDRVFGDNFLIQAYVYQHDFYEKFNASSLNTFRVYTYRSVTDDSVHVLQAMLRVGGEGSAVDNISKGGKACGIDHERGIFNGIVCDVSGNFFDRVGEVDIKNEVALFNYEEVVSKAIELAKKQFYTRLIGFDFCVDKKGDVKLIELNNYDVGVDVLQMCNGPLFREFTDEVIDYCQQQKKNFRFIIR